MYLHHTKAIDDFLQIYKEKDEYIAILLAGSLAHGFAKSGSDIDIILVATEDEYSRRAAEGKLAFSLWDICTYQGGYIDCKVVSLESLALIAEKGSDPARYAFKDAVVLFSRTDLIEPLLRRIVQYPVEQKASREYRFVCQVLAWKWYMSQAVDKKNPYLLHLATQKLALFACRAVLNRNEALYPYHKWLLEETRKVRSKPDGFDVLIAALLESPSFEAAQKVTDALFAYLGMTEKGTDWPNRFMADSEMNWVDHEPPVDDL